jgi:hypothetical protein
MPTLSNVFNSILSDEEYKKEKNESCWMWQFWKSNMLTCAATAAALHNSQNPSETGEKYSWVSQLWDEREMPRKSSSAKGHVAWI